MADLATKRNAAKAEQLSSEMRDVKARLDQLAAIKQAKKLTPQQIRENIDLLFQKYDVSPVEELIKMAMSTQSEALAAKIWLSLVEYMLPKVKSIEVSGAVEHTHKVVIRRFGKDDEEGQQKQTAPMKTLAHSVAETAVNRVIDVEAKKS